jgi:hypothetical protein
MGRLLMARKQVSQFHSKLVGNAPETLKNKSIREAFTVLSDIFSVHFPESQPWERLCDIRDHVNALIGAHADLDQARNHKIIIDMHDGKYDNDPKGRSAALDELKSSPYSINDIYAEVDRQGIPED